MIKPNLYESFDKFAERFLNDEQIKADFPDEKHRLAIAISMFEVRNDFVKSIGFTIFGEKNIDFGIKDLSYSDKKLKVKGQFAGFENRDIQGEMIDAKSVKKTIDERGIFRPLLADHLKYRTLAVKLDSISIKSTGLNYEATIEGGDFWRDLDIPIQTYIDLIYENKAKKHSFGYSYDSRKTEKLADGTLYLKEINIKEVSILTIEPANVFTPLLSVECHGDACKTLNHLKSQITDENQYQYFIQILSEKPNLLKSLLDYVPEIPHVKEQPRIDWNTLQHLF